MQQAGWSEDGAQPWTLPQTPLLPGSTGSTTPSVRMGTLKPWDLPQLPKAFLCHCWTVSQKYVFNKASPDSIFMSPDEVLRRLGQKDHSCP